MGVLECRDFLINIKLLLCIYLSSTIIGFFYPFRSKIYFSNGNIWREISCSSEIQFSSVKNYNIP